MSIIMQAPYTTLTKTIKLRNPDLNDGDATSNKVIIHKTMSGTIKTFVKTPQNRRFDWHFSNLTISQAQELSDFLVYAMGKDILLTHFDSTLYKVRCLTVIPDFKTTGLGTGLTTVKEAVEIDLQLEVVP